MNKHSLISLLALLAAALMPLSCKKQSLIPEVPSGPQSRRAGAVLTYSTSATGPGESLAVRFDWGDGDTSDWSAWLASGSTSTDSHAWSAVGNYSVRAQAMTPAGTISDWSTPLVVPIVPTWTRTIGGSYSDEGSGVVQASDGGYVVAGFTSSFGAGDADVYLIKTDPAGNVDWIRTFGGTNIDCGYSVSATSNGGYVISGTLGDSGYLVKTDAQGNKLWERILGANYHHRPGQMVLQSSDGGYAVMYEDDTSSYLVKTDASGNQVWVARLDLEGESVLEAGDSSLVIAGGTYSQSSREGDVGLVKISRSGTLVWNRTYAMADNQDGCSLQPTADGGYIIAGFDWAKFRLLLVKTDADGLQSWTREFGGQQCDGRSIAPTADGGYVIAGWAHHQATLGDAYLLRIDANGDSLWATSLGDSSDEIAYSVRQTSDGGFVIAGTRFTNGLYGDVLLIKTDSRGEVTP